MEKKADGAYVFRSGRAEEREVQRHSSSRQKTMETLFAKIQAQFEKDQAGKYLNYFPEKQELNYSISLK